MQAVTINYELSLSGLTEIIIIIIIVHISLSMAIFSLNAHTLAHPSTYISHIHIHTVYVHATLRRVYYVISAPLGSVECMAFARPNSSDDL